MPKTFLVFSRKGIQEEERENLVAQLQMVADAMQIELNVLDAHKNLEDRQLDKIAGAVFELLEVRQVDQTLLDEHRINMDLHALRSEGLFDNNYCVILTGKIDYISGHYENGYVAHDNVCFIKNLQSETVMAMINEIFSNLAIG